jgi:hypothetical protein
MGEDATYGLAVDEPGGHPGSTSLHPRTASDTHYFAHISVSWLRVQQTLSCTDCGMNDDPNHSSPRLEVAATYEVVQNPWVAIELHAIHSFFHFPWSFPLPKAV